MAAPTDNDTRQVAVIHEASKAFAVLSLLGVLSACAPAATDPGTQRFEKHYSSPSPEATEPTFNASPRKPPGNKGTCDPSNTCAPLTIHTEAGANYFLVLRNRGTGMKAATIFIRGGNTFTGGMPLGEYDLAYTSGDTWYGNRLFFGPSSGVSKAESTMDFYETAAGLSGVELTLYGVVGGNMSTSRGQLADLE